MGDHIDGGPAFPSVLYKQTPTENWSSDGMSLRDWFAGQALAGFCAKFPGADIDASYIVQVSVGSAYKVADAMIAARKAAS